MTSRWKREEQPNHDDQWSRSPSYQRIEVFLSWSRNLWEMAVRWSNPLFYFLFVPDILTFDCSLSPLETYSSENQTQLTRRDHRQEMYCVKMHVQLFPSARVFLSGVMMWDRMSERKTEREMVACVDFISLLTTLSICLTAFRKEHHRHLTCSLWHLFVLLRVRIVQRIETKNKLSIWRWISLFLPLSRFGQWCQSRE